MVENHKSKTLKNKSL